MEAGGDVFVVVVVVTMVREEETMMARDLAARASGVTEHMNCSNAIDESKNSKTLVDDNGAGYFKLFGFC